MTSLNALLADVESITDATPRQWQQARDVLAAYAPDLLAMVCGEEAS